MFKIILYALIALFSTNINAQDYIQVTDMHHLNNVERTQIIYSTSLNKEYLIIVLLNLQETCPKNFLRVIYSSVNTPRINGCWFADHKNVYIVWENHATNMFPVNKFYKITNHE